MDAREQLRRFLEQRREAGETELVFDQLSVDDAMRMLGALPREGSASRLQASGQERNVQIEKPEPVAPANAGDWRAVLKDAGAEPASGPGSRYSMPVPATTAANSHAIAPIEQLPAGIVIGGAGKDRKSVV